MRCNKMADNYQNEIEKNSQDMIAELLAEVEKTVPKVEYVGEPVYPSKRARRKAEREANKHLNPKPAALVFIAELLTKLFPLIMTIYTILIVPIFGVMFELVLLADTNGWQSILHTPKTLWIIGYIVVFFILKELQFVVYKYANE